MKEYDTMQVIQTPKAIVKKVVPTTHAALIISQPESLEDVVTLEHFHFN